MFDSSQIPGSDIYRQNSHYIRNLYCTAFMYLEKKSSIYTQSAHFVAKISMKKSERRTKKLDGAVLLCTSRHLCSVGFACI